FRRRMPVDLQAERPSSQARSPAGPQGHGEVRLRLPRELELDHRLRGYAQVAVEDRSGLIGQGPAQLLAPLLRVRGLLEAGEAVGAEVDQFGEVPPIKTQEMVAPHADPAEPRDLQLRLLLRKADQRPEQHVASGQLEAVFAL